MFSSGGGLSGYIHERAGPELHQHLQKVGPKFLAVGDAIVTKGFGLLQIPCERCNIIVTLCNIYLMSDIIHTVGPKIDPPGRKPTVEEEKQLLDAYKSSLDFAIKSSDINTIVSEIQIQ
jgi:O-acetyl-ADP-ribose deacetylase (regulator of RNase III)